MAINWLKLGYDFPLKMAAVFKETQYIYQGLIFKYILDKDSFNSVFPDHTVFVA